MMRRAAIDVLRTRGNSICGRPTVVGSSAAQRSTHDVVSSHHHHCVIGAGVLPRRYFASNTSNKAPATSPQPGSSVRGPTPAPKDKGQEAIEKSERLHAELKEMIAAQKARQIEQYEQPIGSGFISFLKSSKPEMVNIFFAFVCVLLAYQIHGMRAGIRKLLAEGETKEEEIVKLRSLLAELSAEGGNNVVSTTSDGENGDDNIEVVHSHDNNNISFSERLAQRCANIVHSIFEQSEKRVGYSWILGKKLASGDALELEKLVDELQPIILSEIQTLVGDAAYTSEELKERRVAALKEDQHELAKTAYQSLSTSNGSNDVGKKGDAQMGDLMELLEDVHKNDLTDGTKDATGSATDEDAGGAPTKIRRTRYAI